MHDFLPTIILRHRKENLRKCSLTGLESQKEFSFFTYPKKIPPVLEGYCLLTLDAPPLSCDDAHFGLYLIDATWRYAAKMEKTVPPDLPRRSLPSDWRTAYPRRQLDCVDHTRGLASIEALYIAFLITGRKYINLLDRYPFREEFLSINRHLLP